ncbi:MAG: methyltransferase [Deltaproteobacteria bacterium]|nr:methyltransferase [Deltaproteobacteria bacterium]
MVDERCRGFEELMRLARGFQASKIFMVACDLEVFSHLSFPAVVQDLAERLKVNARALEMVLNALTGLGILVKEGEAFRNGELAERYLVAGHENYRGAIFKHLHHTWEGWSDLGPVVVTGSPRDIDPARWVEAHDEAREEEIDDFIWGMEAVARDQVPAALAQLDLSQVANLLDLGGGPGTYAIAFVQRYPQLRATVFDLPRPITIAQENIRRHGVDERIQTRAGNFLKDDIGQGYDFIWMANILHSHSEAQCQFLIGKAAEALMPGGQLAVVDFFLNDDGYSPLSAALFGVHMLAVTAAGRAYKHSEVADWMQAAGFSPPELRRINENSSFLIGAKEK